MRKLSPQRRRVVILASGLASMSGLGPLILQHHSHLRWVWLGVVVVGLVWVFVLLARLRRDENCG